MSEQIVINGKKVYGDRPDVEMSSAFAQKKLGKGVSFEVVPALWERRSNATGNPYYLRVWGIMLEGDLLRAIATTNYGGKNQWFESAGMTRVVLEDDPERKLTTWASAQYARLKALGENSGL